MDNSKPLLRSRLAALQAVYDGPIPAQERRAALAGGALPERRLENRAALGWRREVRSRLRRLRQARRQADAEEALVGDLRVAWAAYRQVMRRGRNLTGHAAGRP